MEPTIAGPAEASGQYVTFFIGSECFAFPLATVVEIIRVPETVKVPLAPPSLLGLASLRGAVLPVLDLRRVLSLPETAHTDASRVMVTDVGASVGLLVDRVARVLEVDPAQVDSSQGVQSTIRADLLTGVVKDVGGRSLVQLLDPARCVGLDFASMVAAGAGVRLASESREGDDAEEGADGSIQIVSFMVDGQEYAFPIAEVEEIVRVPAEVSRVPRAEASVLGIINLRGRLLPLVGMRRVFGLSDVGSSDAERVLVLTLGEVGGRRESVGVVVDQVREVLRVGAAERDGVPGLLTRGGGERRIASVCRLEGGKRLVSVLSSRALLDHQAVQAAVEARGEAAAALPAGQASEAPSDEEDRKLVVFRLASQEFGVLVEAVQEIIRVPEAMSRVPRTEDFVEGMVNLRGSVLPVLDLRTRFGLPRAERTDRQRILVFNQAGTCTGFIVDAVSEVLRLGPGVVEAAPRLSDEQARLLGQVANVRDQKRMIPILDAAALVASVGALAGARLAA